MPATAPAPLPALDYAGVRPAASRFRWVIAALLFFAITINYIDRQVFSILAPDLRKRYHIGDEAYGYITAAFALSYAFGQAFAGRWLDWVGTRVGYAVALGSWSVACMLHALARSGPGFAIFRGLLGVTEAPAFPGAVKTLAEWFPKKERALAMGLANAGSNVGAIAAPLIVPVLWHNFGWQSAFIVTGAIGLLWLLLWIPLYRSPQQHPRVSAAELAHINSDPPEPTGKLRWASLLTYRQTWAYLLGKLITDPIWSFYLFWLPTFFNQRHGVDLKNIGPPLVVIYLLADVGSIGGGWLSSALIKRGWSLNASRKTALLACALSVIPVVFAATVENKWAAVLLLGLATAAHQGFSCNLFTLVSDTFPRRVVGSVTGLGGTAGWAGTALFASLVGLVLGRWGSYVPLFIVAGCAYLLAVLVIHLLLPRLDPAAIPDDGGSSGPRGFDGVRK